MTKIIKLQAENIKKIKAIEIKPTDNTILITGKNGQGKTSVLDCIWWALSGGKNIDSKPIRDGQDKGIIKLELEDLIVIRKFKLKEDKKFTTSLHVENKDGAVFKSPQEMLDNLIGQLSFDPLKFSNMKAKEQFDELRKVIKVDFDFEKNTELKKEIYDERTFVNREIKQLEGEIAGINIPENTPEEEISIVELANKLEEIRINNTKRVRLFNETRNIRNDIISLKAEIEKLSIKEIEKTKEYNSLKNISNEEIQKIQVQLNNSTQINKNVSDKKRKVELTKKFLEKKIISDSLTEKLDDLEENKINAISKVEMPIEKLTFGNNEILYDNIPLSQVNSAKQLEISCAIAMESNKKLKVIRIENVSLLDEDNLKIIKDMAKNKDYQIWMEKVDNTGKIGIVIENGEVKKLN